MITKKEYPHLQKLQGEQKVTQKYKKSQNQRRNKRKINHLKKVLMRTRLKYSMENRIKEKVNQRKRKPKMTQTAPHLVSSKSEKQREKILRKMSSIRHLRKQKLKKRNTKI
jgi:hypothetical protein